MARFSGAFSAPRLRVDRPGCFVILRAAWPPSSSGLGYLVLSQKTGVRFPVGVLKEEKERLAACRAGVGEAGPKRASASSPSSSNG